MCVASAGPLRVIVCLNEAGESTGLSLHPPNVSHDHNCPAFPGPPRLPGLQPLGSIPGALSVAPLCASPFHTFIPPPGSPNRSKCYGIMPTQEGKPGSQVEVLGDGQVPTVGMGGFLVPFWASVSSFVKWELL